MDKFELFDCTLEAIHPPTHPLVQKCLEDACESACEQKLNGRLIIEVFTKDEIIGHAIKQAFGIFEILYKDCLQYPDRQPIRLGRVPYKKMTSEEMGYLKNLFYEQGAVYLSQPDLF